MITSKGYPMTDPLSLTNLNLISIFLIFVELDF